MKIQLFRYILDQRVWRTHIRYTAFYHLYIKLWSLCTWGCKYLYVRCWYFTSYREFNWERYGEKAERWDIENAIHHTYTGIIFIPFYIYINSKNMLTIHIWFALYTHIHLEFEWTKFLCFIFFFLFFLISFRFFWYIFSLALIEKPFSIHHLSLCHMKAVHFL